MRTLRWPPAARAAATTGGNVRATVRAWGAASLVLAFLVVLAPAAHAAHNDDFADAVAITGASGSEQHNNGAAATLESGEPTTTETGPSTIGATVWYSWTAPGSGTANFTTCNWGTGGDTTLGVYTGPAVNNLATVGANNDVAACADSSAGTATSEVSFTAVAGTTYHIQVGGHNGVNVDFQLTWTLASDPTTVEDCKNGGWMAFGFSNQGRCIQFVNTGKDSR